MSPEKEAPGEGISLIFAVIAAVLIPLGPSQRKTPEDMARAAAAARQKDRETAIQMNELAGHIRSMDDARRLVNMVAKEFSDDLPPAWATAGLRERIAEAEYRSATDPAELFPSSAWPTPGTATWTRLARPETRSSRRRRFTV